MGDLNGDGRSPESGDDDYPLDNGNGYGAGYAGYWWGDGYGDDFSMGGLNRRSQLRTGCGWEGSDGR